MYMYTPFQTADDTHGYLYHRNKGSDTAVRRFKPEGKSELNYLKCMHISVFKNSYVKY